MKKSKLIVCDNLGHHPQDQFRFYAHCRECPHRAQLQTDIYPPETKLKVIRERLRCSKCGSRSVKMLTVWCGWDGGSSHGIGEGA